MTRAPPSRPPFLHVSVPELTQRLAQPSPPLLLDVRRGDALRRDPHGLPGAVPLLLDETEAALPDLPRDQPVVVYCLCQGQASSTRVALWLADAGYTDVSVLHGGLPAWRKAGLSLAPLELARRDSVPRWMQRTAGAARTHDPERPMAELAFLPGERLPLKRNLAILFVDIVDSTALVMSLPPEQALDRVQQVMRAVVDVAVQHCGDVHDFQGDGAMLYFAGAAEAAPAAFAMRERVAAAALPALRFALDSGELVVGYVGTRERRHLAMVGAPINRAARMLRLAPPGGIATTEAVVTELQRTAPDLADTFNPLPEPEPLKGFAAPVRVYVASA
jgi:class 3 adenylate cyclase